MKKSIFLLALLLGASTIQAQQVNTLYFLENSPMRHTINPGLFPVSDGYVSLPAIGGTSMSVSNSSLTMSDLIFEQDGKYITALKSPETQQAFLKKFGKFNLSNEQLDVNLLSFGFRLHENGFVHIGLSQKADISEILPRSPLEFVFGNSGLANGEKLSLSGLGVNLNAYTQISAGYTHRINDKLSVGGKVKILLGEAYADVRFDKLELTADKDEWKLNGAASVNLNSPLRLPEGEYSDFKEIQNAMNNQFANFDVSMLSDMFKPSGIGAALDLGATYKVLDMLQVSLAVTDLGFIRWQKGISANISANGSFTGIGEIGINNMDSIGPRFQETFNEIAKSLNTKVIGGSASTQLLHGRLNAGVDANFWNNRVGVGVLNQLQWINGHVYDELTLGASFRPFNWFQLAVSYSLCQNAKFSDIGAGISLMPYDGINLTLTADYIPTKMMNDIPYRTKGVNLEMGLSIVWGTNKKKSKLTEIKTESLTTSTSVL